MHNIYLCYEINFHFVVSIATGLEDKLKSNQREVMESIERIDALYDREILVFMEKEKQ